MAPSLRLTLPSGVTCKKQHANSLVEPFGLWMSGEHAYTPLLRTPERIRLQICERFVLATCPALAAP